MECYLEADDVDGLWSYIQEKVQHLHCKAPFDRDYGMREMHISIPHTNALFFIGQEIKR